VSGLVPKLEFGNEVPEVLHYRRFGGQGKDLPQTDHARFVAAGHGRVGGSKRSFGSRGMLGILVGGPYNGRRNPTVAEAFMSYEGKVRNGVVVLDEGAALAEGTRVRVEPVVDGTSPADKPLLQLAEIIDQFPSDPDWPPDFAAQHDHYLYGTPKGP
jgi:hypothetical protein